MKTNTSIKWQVLRNGIEKYLVKNFKIFVPSSAGNYRILGAHTFVSINIIFPLISKLLKTLKLAPNICKVQKFYNKKKNFDNVERIKNYFNKYQSDKSTTHNYHLVYGSLFKNKKKIKKILEIGLGTNNEKLISNMGKFGKPGASTKAFRDFFENAKVYGADIDKKILFKDHRIKTYYVDQTNIKSLEKLFNKVGKNFDIIIDDGLHAPYANISVIITALNKLKKNGWLVIEDIPKIAKPIWETICCLINLKHYSVLIETKNTYLFLINKK